MRLIDADKYKRGKVINAILSKHGFPIINEISVSDIPTAYDSYNVVEQLNDKNRVVRTDEDLEWNRAIEKAIEIVKGGGIEWEG